MFNKGLSEDLTNREELDSILLNIWSSFEKVKATKIMKLNYLIHQLIRDDSNRNKTMKTLNELVSQANLCKAKKIDLIELKLIKLISLDKQNDCKKFFLNKISNKQNK